MAVSHCAVCICCKVPCPILFAAHLEWLLSLENEHSIVTQVRYKRILSTVSHSVPLTIGFGVDLAVWLIQIPGAVHNGPIDNIAGLLWLHCGEFLHNTHRGQDINALRIKNRKQMRQHNYIIWETLLSVIHRLGVSHCATRTVSKIRHPYMEVGPLYARWIHGWNLSNP